MPVRWVDGNKARVVVDRLASVLGLNENGEVTLPIGPDFEAGSGVLANLFPFEATILEKRRLALTERAVLDCVKSSGLTVDALLHELAKSQTTYLRKPLNQFILLSSVSVNLSPRLVARRMSGCHISFRRFRPRGFTNPDTLRDGGGHFGEAPTDYTVVKVAVEAREPEDAVTYALDAVDLLRALWNFALGYGKWRVSMGGPGSPPVNIVLLGPIHTLHHRSGKPAYTGHWWDPTYVRAITPTSLSPSSFTFEHRARRRLSRSPLGTELSALFLEYVRALDDRLLNAAFVKLWGVLELITASSGMSHEVTVRRGSFLFTERDFFRLCLGHLKDWRNKIAHRGVEADDAEHMLYQLKSFVDPLIRFLLDHHLAFKSLEEFGQFLDLPTDSAILRKRLADLQLASRLHSHRD